jgi:hypothetical protein
MVKRREVTVVAVKEKKEKKEKSEKTAKDDDLIPEAVKRFDRASASENGERERGNADTEFIYSTDQWEDTAKQARGPGRIALTINTLPTFLDQIDGDMRQSRPGITIKPADGTGNENNSKETAEAIEDIIRGIERSSKASRVYSFGGLHAAAGGRGAWRVTTDYLSDTSFQQVIHIERIDNPYSVYFDPAAMRDDKQDGNFFFVVSDMSREEYKEKFGKNPVDFKTDSPELGRWKVEDCVRVAEYFYKKKVGVNHLCLLEDGRTVKQEELEEGDVVLQERDAPVYEIWWSKIDGHRILEGPQKVVGKLFPVVLVWGKQLCVKGKIEVRGIARFAKDSCRLYNYFRTAEAETSALQPKQPYLMPDVCIGPYKKIWDESASKLLPYLPFHVDDMDVQLRPTRERVSDPSPGLMGQSSISKGEIRDTVGIQKAGLGIESNETSGRAIRERKMESDAGQYAYLDNTTDAVCTTGRIILGMIPEIYDTEQSLNVVGKNMKDKVIKVNSQDSLIDLTTGEYAVSISADKSYSTQREELLDKLAVIMPTLPPEQAALITDILFDAMDMPKSDEIANRLRKLLPPGIIDEPTDASDGSSPGAATDGSVQPPPTSAAPPPPPPDPIQVAKVRQEDLKAQQEEVKLKGLELDNLIKEAKLKNEQMGPHKDLIQGNEAAINSAVPAQGGDNAVQNQEG